MNKNKIRLYLDMDGTLAEFKRVSSEDELYMAGFFQNLKPHTNVLDGVCDLRQKNPHIEIYTLSAFLSNSKHALKEKNIWLDTYLPEIKKKTVSLHHVVLQSITAFIKLAKQIFYWMIII